MGEHLYLEGGEGGREGRGEGVRKDRVGKNGG